MRHLYHSLGNCCNTTTICRCQSLCDLFPCGMNTVCRGHYRGYHDYSGASAKDARYCTCAWDHFAARMADNFNETSVRRISSESGQTRGDATLSSDYHDSCFRGKTPNPWHPIILIGGDEVCSWEEKTLLVI